MKIVKNKWYLYKGEKCIYFLNIEAILIIDSSDIHSKFITALFDSMMIKKLIEEKDDYVLLFYVLSYKILCEFYKDMQNLNIK